MKKIFYLGLVITTILFVYLLTKFYIRNSVLGVNVSPLSKDSLEFPDSEFKFYNILKPNTTFEDRGMWTDESVHYNFNADGLNDRFNYETEKPGGVYRILTLGDSYTFGQFVDTKNNWTEKLEDILNQNNSCTKIQKFEVINLGMRGFDVPYIVKRLNDFGLKYNPDLIVWLESGSGFDRNNELIQPWGKECEKKVAEGTYKTKSNLKFYACWADAQTEVYKGMSPQEIENTFTPWVRQFFVMRKEVPVIFSIFANLNSESKNFLNERVEGQPNTYINELPNLASKNANFPDGHPNLKGQEIISGEIYKFILDNKSKLMSCN